MKVSAKTLRFGMNIWPPYLGAGVRITHIADDWSSATATLRHRRLNRNAVGTTFGGSMSSMTDPFFMLLLSNRLGNEYVVWDTAGEIQFHTPGRTNLVAHMEVPQESVDKILAETADGSKSLTWFSTTITDADDTPVASVRRQVYARKKKRD